jgi:hypothetical protein
MKTSRVSALGLLAALVLPSLALAVDPPPGGGYPGENTALGDDALFSLTTGTNNSANGFDALYNTTTGLSNTANGHNVLFSNTTGSSNTATGESTLYSNTTGGGNVAEGTYAMYYNTTGEFNVALGHYALFVNTTADGNTALGVTALFNNTEGGDNVAVGDGAVFGNTTGSRNVGLGGSTLSNDSLGSNNVAVGDSALAYVRAGSNNIALGQDAGLALRSGDWNIYLGNIGAKEKESGTIRIGGQNRNTSAYIAGIRGVPVADGAEVVVSRRGQLGTVSSSARFKDDIQPMKDASEAILSLQPVTFRYKKELDSLGRPQFGLVAEQVAKVDPDLVARDDSGQPYTVRYEAVNAMLLNEFLKEHRTVEAQGATIAGQQGEIAELKAAVAGLTRAVKAQTSRAGQTSRQQTTDEPVGRFVATGG